MHWGRGEGGGSIASGNGNLSLSLPPQAWGCKIALALLALGTAVSLLVSNVFDQTSVNCSFIKLSLATLYLSTILLLPRFRLIYPNTVVFILGRVVNP